MVVANVDWWITFRFVLTFTLQMAILLVGWEVSKLCAFSGGSINAHQVTLEIDQVALNM
jgi:hypothetical protein